MPVPFNPKNDLLKVVIVGGGTGIGPVIRGLKRYGGCHITVVCTTFDSGGHTRTLRDKYGWLPQGDLRRAFIALDTSADDTLRFLFSDRFEHNGDDVALGNQIIWRLQKEYGEREGLKRLHRLFNLRGQVLPVSFDRADLMARLDDGRVLQGENLIDTRDPRDKARIETVWLEPAAFVDAEVEQAILDADAIILGPGDVYSSIGAALRVRGMAIAIGQSRGRLIYIPNLMTKPAETPDFTAADFCAAVLYEDASYTKRLVGRGRFDAVFVNNTRPPENLCELYLGKDNSKPVVWDAPSVQHELNCLSKRVFYADFLNVEGELIRHDERRLAYAIRQYLDDEYPHPRYDVIIDLDDTLCCTTRDLKGDHANLPHLKLAPGALELLDHLGEVTLLTQGTAAKQHEKIDHLGIRRYCKNILVVSGPEQKKTALQVLRDVALDTDKLLVVGDRLDSEIRFAGELQIPSIRVKLEDGKYADLEPAGEMDTPTHTVADLHGALALLLPRRPIVFRDFMD